MLWKDSVVWHLRGGEMLVTKLWNWQDTVALTLHESCYAEYMKWFEMDFSAVAKDGTVVIYNTNPYPMDISFFRWEEVYDDDGSNWWEHHCTTYTSEIGEMIFESYRRRPILRFLWCNPERLKWNKYNLLIHENGGGSLHIGEDNGEAPYYEPKYVDGKVQLEVLRA